MNLKLAKDFIIDINMEVRVWTKKRIFLKNKNQKVKENASTVTEEKLAISVPTKELCVLSYCLCLPSNTVLLSETFL